MAEIIDGFITEGECDIFLGDIKSQLTDNLYEVQSVTLDKNNPFYSVFCDRICEFTNIPTKEFLDRIFISYYPVHYNQQNYENDAIDQKIAHDLYPHSGNIKLTFAVFLNNSDNGGILFENNQNFILSKIGSGIMWNNSFDDGRVFPASYNKIIAGSSGIFLLKTLWRSKTFRPDIDEKIIKIKEEIKNYKP